MEKTDARKLSQDAQYQIRRQVVKLRQRGMSYAEIADVVGVALSYACRVWAAGEKHRIWRPWLPKKLKKGTPILVAKCS